MSAVGDGSIDANEHGLADFDYLELSSSGFRVSEREKRQEAGVWWCRICRGMLRQGRFSTLDPLFTALLREAYDKDGNGHIATDELVESAKLTAKTRNCNRMLWKGLLLAIFFVLAP